MSDPKHDMSFSEGRYLGDLDSTPREALQNPFADVADKIANASLVDRERYVRAWLAETGLKPSECVLEERVFRPDDRNVMRRELVIRRRETQLAPDPEAFKRGWEAATKQCEDRVEAANRSAAAAHATSSEALNFIRLAYDRIAMAARWLEPSAELHKVHEEREKGKPE